MVLIVKSRLAYVSWYYRYSLKSAFISVHHCIMTLSAFTDRCLFRLARVSRYYFTPDRRLFRLAYVSWHHRYFHITVYFGSAKVSRHRYSSHIVRYLIIVAYDSSTIYHGYSTISVSEASSHRILLGKPNDTSARLVSMLVR